MRKPVVIVGGGISGVQAALDLAEVGAEVYLVERKPAIGGLMAQFDKTFPTNDCAMCILSPKLVSVGRSPNIRLLTNAELASVMGCAGDFTVEIVKHPRFVDEDKCIGCGACSQICPKKAPNEFDLGLASRKAIYVPYPQAVPLKYTIDKTHCTYLIRKKCKLCVQKCPTGAINFEQSETRIKINASAIILCSGAEPLTQAISQYGYQRYKNVLTSLEFERYLSASGPTSGVLKRPSDGREARKIAILQCVGSRERAIPYCSAVCCMYAIKEALCAQEHLKASEITIFFIDIRAAGKGFAEYYERAQAAGIKFIRSKVAEIKEKPDGNLIVRHIADGIDGKVAEAEFELVVLATALQSSADGKRICKIAGVELTEYGFCKTKDFYSTQTTVGGIFCAGLLAGPKDIPTAVVEGSAAAAGACTVLSEQKGLQFAGMKKDYPPEKDVRFHPPRIGVFVCRCGINIGNYVDVPSVVEYAKRLKFVIHAEECLFACSEDMQSRIKECIQNYSLNRIVVAACTPRTHEPLFRETCRESGLNPYLFEMANIRDQCSWVHMADKNVATAKAKDLLRMACAKTVLLYPLKTSEIKIVPSCLIIGGGVSGLTAAECIAKQGYRVHLVEKTETLGGNLRKVHSFIDSTLKPEQLLANLINSVTQNPNVHLYTNVTIGSIEGYVGNFKTTLSNGTQLQHGAVIVATGGCEYKPSEYFYHNSEKIITQLELEERLQSKKLDFDRIRNVVMIQCVGSRENGREYCSRICCIEALKNAIYLKTLNPNIEIHILYRDVCAYGFYELYYKKARELGILFTRYELHSKPAVRLDNGVVKVEVNDLLLGKKIVFKPDLVVLSTALIPNNEIAKMLKVPVGKDSFFLEAHMKLRPVEFATDGIFLCGLARSPKFTADSIAEAYAAGMKAVTLLSKTAYQSEAFTAVVDKAKCSGCNCCAAICPYNAIELVDGKAQVNEFLCKCCGLCASACKNSAITQQGFSEKQLIEQIAALSEM